MSLDDIIKEGRGKGKGRDSRDNRNRGGNRRGNRGRNNRRDFGERRRYAKKETPGAEKTQSKEAKTRLFITNLQKGVDNEELRVNNIT
jgi:hypothetical protein